MGTSPATGCDPGDAAAILIKDNAVVGKMIGKGYGCQLADSGQRVFSHHQRIIGVNADPHIRMVDAIDDPEHFIAERFGVIFQADPDTRILSDGSSGFCLAGDFLQLGNYPGMKGGAAYRMGSVMSMLILPISEPIDSAMAIPSSMVWVRRSSYSEASSEKLYSR